MSDDVWVSPVYTTSSDEADGWAAARAQCARKVEALTVAHAAALSECRMQRDVALATIERIRALCDQPTGGRRDQRMGVPIWRIRQALDVAP